MLEELIDEAEKFGLEVHMGKTKILSNSIGKACHLRHTVVGHSEIKILGPEAATMYLGKFLNLVEPHDIEIKHRMPRAWAKFSKYKDQLTDQSYSLYQRLRLFDCIVTPTAMYGCSAWAMTTSRVRELRSTQRKMLHMILGRGRRLVSYNPSSDCIGEEFNIECDAKEPWVDWIRSTTHEALAEGWHSGMG